MKRGEIWTIADGPDYTSKPRPAVILQDERFDATDSLTICGITTTYADSPLFRVPVIPDPQNGLRMTGYIMADKVTTVRRSKVGKRIGCLDDATLSQLSETVVLFLGLVMPRGRRK